MIHDPGFLAFRETSDRLCESMPSASCYQAATFPQAQVRFHDNKSLHLILSPIQGSQEPNKQGSVFKGSHQSKELIRNRKRVGDVQQSLRVEYTFTGLGVECLSYKAHISLRTRALS